MFHRVCPLFQPLFLPFRALMTVVPNRSGIHPLVEGSGRQVHPKTTTFCPVLGFTPSRQPYRAYQSQNDLEQRYSGPSVALPGWSVWHIRKRSNSKCQQKMSGRAWGNVFWHGLDASRVWPYSNPYRKRPFFSTDWWIIAFGTETGVLFSTNCEYVIAETLTDLSHQEAAMKHYRFSCAHWACPR